MTVSSKAARGFQAASESERKFAEEIVESIFAKRTPVRAAKFRRMADEANAKAVSKGLTQEILQSILDEE